MHFVSKLQWKHQVLLQVMAISNIPTILKRTGNVKLTLFHSSVRFFSFPNPLLESEALFSYSYSVLLEFAHLNFRFDFTNVRTTSVFCSLNCPHLKSSCRYIFLVLTASATRNRAPETILIGLHFH